MPSLSDYYNSIQYTNDAAGQAAKAHNDAVAALTAAQDANPTVAPGNPMFQPQRQATTSTLASMAQALAPQSSGGGIAPNLVRPASMPAPQPQAMAPLGPQSMTSFRPGGFQGYPQQQQQGGPFSGYQGQTVWPGQNRLSLGNLGALAQSAKMSPTGGGKGNQTMGTPRF